MEVIRLDRVSLLRRTQEEFSYDLKKTLFSLLEGKYRKPARRQVLDQVDLVVEAGEKVGIIGANGSGKSTLLKVICNILDPTSGQVRVRGKVAPLIELGAGFDPEISVVDNIILYGVMLGFSEKEMRRRIPEILDFSELQDYAAVPVKALSSGMVARLGFSIATDVQPDILILDEVLSVGDESFKNKCKRRIERFWEANATILLVSHDLHFLQKSCERVIWLERGKVRMAGNSAEIVEAYIESSRSLDEISNVLEPELLVLEDAAQQEDSIDKPELDESDFEAPDVAPLPLPIPPPLPRGEAFLPAIADSESFVITRVFLCDETRQVISTVAFGKPFYVGFEYTITALIQKLQIGVHVRDSQDRVILELASNNGLSVTGEIRAPGKHCTYAKIPAPLLIPGQYTIFGMGAYEEGMGHHYRNLSYILAFDVEITDNHQTEWFGQEIVHPIIEWQVE